MIREIGLTYKRCDCFEVDEGLMKHKQLSMDVEMKYLNVSRNKQEHVTKQMRTRDETNESEGSGKLINITRRFVNLPRGS